MFTCKYRLSLNCSTEINADSPPGGRFVEELLQEEDVDGLIGVAAADVHTLGVRNRGLGRGGNAQDVPLFIHTRERQVTMSQEMWRALS